MSAVCRGIIWRMKFRKLRIAWSVGWGVVAVLLVVLWVRSYFWSDIFMRPTPARVWNFKSEYGRAGVIVENRVLPVATHHLIRQSRPTNEEARSILKVFLPTGARFGFQLAWNKQQVGAVTPLWFPTAVSIFCTVAPWFAPRFSLRTLLVAMTVVAVLLGMAVWFAR
jgi:hypothetical protein